MNCYGDASNMCPIPGKYKITLSTSYDLINGIHRKYTNADNNIADDQPGPTVETFKTAIVQTGKWILYEDKDYNDYKKGVANFVVLDQGTHVLDFQPKSLRPITSYPNSVTLYTHPNYGGRQQVYTGTRVASIPEFPIFNEAGVSSVIITLSKRWQFFYGPNYTGSSFQAGPGFYKTMAEIDTNVREDAIQSFKQL